MADESKRIGPDGTERYIDARGRVRRRNPFRSGKRDRTHDKAQQTTKSNPTPIIEESHEERRHKYFSNLGKKGGKAGKGRPKWRPQWGPKPPRI